MPSVTLASRWWAQRVIKLSPLAPLNSSVGLLKVNDISIRFARIGDASFLARVILISGRGHLYRGIWDVILEGQDNDKLDFLSFLATTEKTHLFHFSGFLIAEVGTQPVAALGGFDPQDSGMLALMDALPEVFQKMAIPKNDQLAGFQRYSRLLPCIPDHTEDAWIIDSVATLPKFRLRGITDKLLTEILKKGSEHGFCRAQLNVIIGNIPAQHAYEKHGFAVMEEKRHLDFEKEIGAPGMVHMVCQSVP